MSHGTHTQPPCVPWLALQPSTGKRLTTVGWGRLFAAARPNALPCYRVAQRAGTSYWHSVLWSLSEHGDTLRRPFGRNQASDAAQHSALQSCTRISRSLIATNLQPSRDMCQTCQQSTCQPHWLGSQPSSVLLSLQVICKDGLCRPGWRRRRTGGEGKARPEVPLRLSHVGLCLALPLPLWPSTSARPVLYDACLQMMEALVGEIDGVQVGAGMQACISAQPFLDPLALRTAQTLCSLTPFAGVHVLPAGTRLGG